MFAHISYYHQCSDIQSHFLIPSSACNQDKQNCKDDFMKTAVIDHGKNISFEFNFESTL